MPEKRQQEWPSERRQCDQSPPAPGRVGRQSWRYLHAPSVASDCLAHSVRVTATDVKTQARRTARSRTVIITSSSSPPSLFWVFSPYRGLCQGFPREQWSPTFRSPTQADQNTSCQEITQRDPALHLCSEFTVSRKHLQFFSFSYTYIPSHWLGSQLQLMEANQGLDKLGDTGGNPHCQGEQRGGLTPLIPSSLMPVVPKKGGAYLHLPP